MRRFTSGNPILETEVCALMKVRRGEGRPDCLTSGNSCNNGDAIVVDVALRYGYFLPSVTTARLAPPTFRKHLSHSQKPSFMQEATRAIKQALAPGTEDSAPEAGVITLLYDSGWDKAFLHFAADGGTWTELPGVQFGFDAEQNSKVRRLACLCGRCRLRSLRL